MRWRSNGLALLVMAVMVVMMSHAFAADDAASSAVELTPPRLSYAEGRVSFWRPGAEDWAPARVNTPLAAGDAFYISERSTVEIQIGSRAFVRARENTRLGLGNLERDFVQVTLTAGQVSLDLRALPNDVTVELGTPNVLFTIEQAGYYRAEVDGDITRFVTRRGGRATLTVADHPPQTIAPSEEVIVRGAASAPETYAAPAPDSWDQWNYARTDHETEALGARYVSPGIYGVGALDDWGTWRVVPPYGPLWLPDKVALGWAPYSAGSWMWDPAYGWTWVDDAPWGWAPFHYGRWVFVNGRWAWAPGPVIARAVYAPALVAFFGLGHGVSVRIGIGAPAIGWVALGWGEPLRPWWGRPGFIGAPWWGGWGGPRVVNNTVIDRTTHVNVNNIVYEHHKTPRAHVATGEHQFGRGPLRGTQFTPASRDEIEHIRDVHPVRPGPLSVVPARGDAVRPPAALASRPVFATREPRYAPVPWQSAPEAKPAAKLAAPAPRIIAPPPRPQSDVALPRPSFGEKGRERQRPPSSPRFDEPRRAPPAAVQPAPQRPLPPAPTAPAAPAAPRATPPAQPVPTPAPAERRAAPPAPSARPAAPPPAGRPAPSDAPKPEVRPAPRAAPSAPSARAQPDHRDAQPPRALPGRPANEISSRQAEGTGRPPLQSKPTPKDKPGGQH